MFSKQHLLATVVATVTMFILGYLIWGVATVDFFEGHTINSVMKDPPLFPFIILANLIGAFSLCVIYGKWARGYHSMGGGFQFGVWIGIFVGLGMGLLWYGTSEMMDLQGHLVEAVLDIVYYGIVGAVIGLMFKATQPKGENA
jgi:choline-glycine betaine transporter